MIENVTDDRTRAVLRRVRTSDDLLDEVRSVVGDRELRYGHPADHWGRTIGAINVLFAHKLREPLTVADWPVFMALDKLAREAHRTGRDNTVDAIGYLLKRADLT